MDDFISRRRVWHERHQRSSPMNPEYLGETELKASIQACQVVFLVKNAGSLMRRFLIVYERFSFAVRLCLFLCRFIVPVKLYSFPLYSAYHAVAKRFIWYNFFTIAIVVIRLPHIIQHLLAIFLKCVKLYCAEWAAANEIKKHCFEQTGTKESQQQIVEANKTTGSAP